MCLHFEDPVQSPLEGSPLTSATYESGLCSQELYGHLLHSTPKTRNESWVNFLSACSLWSSKASVSIPAGSKWVPQYRITESKFSALRGWRVSDILIFSDLEAFFPIYKGPAPCYFTPWHSHSSPVSALEMEIKLSRRHSDLVDI